MKYIFFLFLLCWSALAQEVLYFDPDKRICTKDLSLSEKLAIQRGAVTDPDIPAPEARDSIKKTRRKELSRHPLLAAKGLVIYKWAVNAQYRFFGKRKHSSNEADAFRHFIGIYRLAQFFGIKTAVKLGDLREKNDLTMASLMDRYNNEIALSAYWHNPDLKGDDLFDYALLLIRNGSLVVLNPEFPERFIEVNNGNEDFQLFAHRLLDFRLP